MFTDKQSLNILSLQNESSDFPKDANVRIRISGLAFCNLTTKRSIINFLSHVPNHKLFIYLIQRRRDSVAPIFVFATPIEQYHTISIDADNSTEPGSIAATNEELPLREIVNISQLHGGQIKPQWTPVQANLTPISLSVGNCRFYTENTTKEEFNFIENDGTSMPTIKATKKIGFVMGGKISCSKTTGKIKIKIEGADESYFVRPLGDGDGDFVYDIFFSNHCKDQVAGSKQLSGESYFKYYYDLLQDSQNPVRKFDLQRIP